MIMAQRSPLCTHPTYTQPHSIVNDQLIKEIYTFKRCWVSLLTEVRSPPVNKGHYSDDSWRHKYANAKVRKSITFTFMLITTAAPQATNCYSAFQQNPILMEHEEHYCQHRSLLTYPESIQSSLHPTTFPQYTSILSSHVYGLTSGLFCLGILQPNFICTYTHIPSNHCNKVIIWVSSRGWDGLKWSKIKSAQWLFVYIPNITSHQNLFSSFKQSLTDSS